MSVFTKGKDDVLKCLVLFTVQRYLVYSHKGGKKLLTFQKLESECC